MWRLTTMVSTYDEEAVVISVVERHGSGDQLLGGGLLLIKELTGGQDVTTCSGGLLHGSFDNDDLSVEPLLEDLSVGGRKGYDNP
jgi:hypothetical protein